MIIDNEKYNQLKKELLNSNDDILDFVTMLAGDTIFNEYLKPVKDDNDGNTFKILFFQSYLLMLLGLKLYGDPEIEPEQLEKIANAINRSLEKIEKILNKPTAIIKKVFPSLVHSV